MNGATRRIALVFGAAPQPGAEAFYRALLTSAEIVVGADLGAVHSRRLRRLPDVAVGDFDSAAGEEVRALERDGVRVVRHPSGKDETDLDLAIAEARSLGATEIVVTGAFRDRPDHTLAAFGSLMRAAHLGARAEEPGWTAWPLVEGVSPAIELTLDPGTTVSVVSPGGASGVTLEGFEFPLVDATLEPLSSLGVSNVVSGPDVRVSIGSGSAFVIVVTHMT